MIRTGRDIVFEALRARDVRHVFGNPGTSELAFMDRLLDEPSLTYVLGLMEPAVITMADAYAQASGRVGFVNLHIAPGLGNAIGSLHNAREKRTPLVVTAGQTDTRMRLREPLTHGDLVAMAAPVTKWSVQAENADELPLLLDRAFRVAGDDPAGPVFVSLPVNVLDASTSAEPVGPSVLFRAAEPDPAGVAAAVRLLAAARQPVIVAGDDVARHSAIDELVALAEGLGADVWAETLPAHPVFPTRHPLFRGRMPQDQVLMREGLGNADVVVFVGGDFFEETWYSEGAFSAGPVRLIQVETTADRIGRNYPVACGLVAGLKPALAALRRGLDAAMDDRHRSLASARLADARRRRQEADAEFGAALAAEAGRMPMSPARLIAELSRALPERAMVTAEIFANTRHLFATNGFAARGDFLSARGGGIGQAIPSAIGMKLAHPDRPVLALSGDGSALFTLQALWTAAHHEVPIVACILNNGSYQILKDGLDRFRSDRNIPTDRPYPFFDLARPSIDFVSLARGFGVEAERIEHPEAVGPALTRAFASGRPWLLDVAVGTA